jgi:hypothetical protein
MTTTIAPSIATRPSRGTRRAWFVAGTILAVAAIGVGTANVVGGFAFARVHFTRSLHGPIRTIDVSNGAGHVNITTGANRVASIVGRGVRGLAVPEHHESLVGGRLVVRASCPTLNVGGGCSMHLTIRVPAGVPMHVRASGGGITITGTDATIDASSSGGGVHVDGARGALHLSSSGGSVTATDVHSSTVEASSSGGGVRLEFAVPPVLVHASSSGGGVHVSLPDTLDTYRVDAGSSGGKNVVIRQDPTSNRLIYAHSSGGGVTVEYAR